MKVAELRRLLEAADPEWEVIVARMVTLPGSTMGGDEETFERMVDPTAAHPVEAVMMTRDMSRDGGPPREYLAIGFDRDRHAGHPILDPGPVEPWDESSVH